MNLKKQSPSTAKNIVTGSWIVYAISASFLVAVLATCLLFCWEAWQEDQFRQVLLQEGVQGTARVDDCEKNNRGHFVFDVIDEAGKRRRYGFRDRFSNNSDRCQEGVHVTIVYLPLDPSQARLAGSPGEMPVYLFGIYISALLFVMLCYFPLSEYRQKNSNVPAYIHGVYWVISILMYGGWGGLAILFVSFYLKQFFSLF